jgi:hypothetical protein
MPRGPKAERRLGDTNQLGKLVVEDREPMPERETPRCARLAGVGGRASGARHRGLTSRRGAIAHHRR